jgi:TrmH family RNA methyltransferase
MGSATNVSRQAATSRAPEPITSRDNRWLKRFHAALAGEPPRRAADEVVAVEGLRLVSSALQSGVDVVAVLASASGERHLAQLASAIPASARILTTTDRLFASIAATETPQGIAALVRPRTTVFDDIVGGLPLVIILAGVQDPGNVGALIRAAEAFGVSGVVACSAAGTGTANPFAPKALRASAGSALRLPVLRGIAAPVLFAQLRVAGVRIYAASPQLPERGKPKTLAPWEIDWCKPAALLIGNEGAGLPADLAAAADAFVRIPQSAASGAIVPMDSLNAALAGGILLYEAARQRGSC